MTSVSVIVDRNPHLTHIALHEFDEACLYCVNYLTDDVDFLAKYSFLKEAGEKVSTYGLNLQELGGLESFNVVKRAKSRVLEAVRYHKVSGPDPKLPIEVELLSFPVAAVLVKLLGEERLTIRYAQSETLRVTDYLVAEFSGRKDNITGDHLLAWFYHRLLGSELERLGEVLQIGGENLRFRLPFMPFLLKISRRFQDDYWSLSNHTLDQGFVYLRRKEVLRIVQMGVEDLLVKRIREMEDPSSQVPAQLLKIVEDIRKEVPAPPAPQSNDVKPDRYPPCVLQAMSMLFKGENLPHYSRLLLTTYLLKTGSQVDEVVDLFSHSPDYNERMTRYQVDHLNGHKGGRVQYSPPSCRTLETHGCCCRSKECGEIKHPLRFRSSK